MNAESQDLRTVDVWNTIGVIRGTEVPNEYVLLSAHLDSWDGGSSATDTGTIMEAMQILQTVYPLRLPAISQCFKRWKVCAPFVQECLG